MLLIILRDFLCGKGIRLWSWGYGSVSIANSGTERTSLFFFALRQFQFRKELYILLALSLLFILPNLGYDFLEEDRKVKYTIKMHFLNKT